MSAKACIHLTKWIYFRKIRYLRFDKFFNLLGARSWKRVENFEEVKWRVGVIKESHFGQRSIYVSIIYKRRILCA